MLQSAYAGWPPAVASLAAAQVEGACRRTLEGCCVGQFDGSDGVRQLEERCQTLFHHMLDGVALCEMIFDAQGKPEDFRYLAVNPAFETMTGLRAETVVGKRALEALPTTEARWIE